MSHPETLRILCPNLTCRKILAVPVTARGKTVRCKGCQTNIRVPDAKAEDGKDAKQGKAA
jgi:RNase P subunit RPR2